MALTPEVVSAHIQRWEPRLSKGNRPYRRNWPSRLFRHEPLENAVEILKSGVLLSRKHIAGRQPRDIAPPEIVNARVAAHQSVRLYFRPKSPTQYRIEGIRKPCEIFQGRHAPVLIIMVFQASDILTQDGVSFSDGNMQSDYTITGSTPPEFEAIPFEQVYHEGYFDPHSELGKEILRRRCAEVLLPSPLPLQGNLQSVLCRSTAERSTLLQLLGDVSDIWRERIRVYTEPGLFESIYAYISSVDGGPSGIRFTYNARRDGKTVKTEVIVYDEREAIVFHSGPAELDPGKKWVIEKKLDPGDYLTRIILEDCLAYEAKFIVDDFPF